MQHFTKACNCAATFRGRRFVIPAAHSDLHACGAGTAHRSFARDGHPLDEKIRAQRTDRDQEIHVSNYRPQASEANCGAKLTLLIRECPDRRIFGREKISSDCDGGHIPCADPFFSISALTFLVPLARPNDESHKCRAGGCTSASARFLRRSSQASG